MTGSLEDHKIVSENEWIEARKALLKKEKELTILGDQLNQQRREQAKDSRLFIIVNPVNETGG